MWVSSAQDERTTSLVWVWALGSAFFTLVSSTLSTSIYCFCSLALLHLKSTGCCSIRPACTARCNPYILKIKMYTVQNNLKINSSHSLSVVLVLSVTNVGLVRQYCSNNSSYSLFWIVFNELRIMNCMDDYKIINSLALLECIANSFIYVTEINETWEAIMFMRRLL